MVSALLLLICHLLGGNRLPCCLQKWEEKKKEGEEKTYFLHIEGLCLSSYNSLGTLANFFAFSFERATTTDNLDSGGTTRRGMRGRGALTFCFRLILGSSASFSSNRPSEAVDWRWGMRKSEWTRTTNSEVGKRRRKERRKLAGGEEQETFCAKDTALSTAYFSRYLAPLVTFAPVRETICKSEIWGSGRKKLYLFALVEDFLFPLLRHSFFLFFVFQLERIGDTSSCQFLGI